MILPGYIGIILSDIIRIPMNAINIIHQMSAQGLVHVAWQYHGF